MLLNQLQHVKKTVLRILIFFLYPIVLYTFVHLVIDYTNDNKYMDKSAQRHIASKYDNREAHALGGNLNVAFVFTNNDNQKNENENNVVNYKNDHNGVQINSGGNNDNHIAVKETLTESIETPPPAPHPAFGIVNDGEVKEAVTLSSPSSPLSVSSTTSQQAPALESLQFLAPVAAQPPAGSPPGESVNPATGPSNNSSPTMVVILSYQRCGSTFLGELFNHNPNVFYQFEPLDSLYSSLYGTPYGWNVPTDINNFGDGTQRKLPQFEVDEVSKFLRRLLTCDVNSLPTDTFVHPYQKHMLREFRSTADYITCLRGNVTTTCPKNVQWFCGSRFGQVRPYRQEECLRLMKNVEDESVKISPEVRQRFRQFETCKQTIRTDIVETCLDLFTEACESHSQRVRAVKVVRASMRSMEALLRDDPNFHVIHLIRDPRGVALSRANLHRSVRGQWANSVPRRHPREMIIREALMYCRTVVEDIRVRRDLEQRYPGRILSVIYEDVVADVKEATRRIHEFVGLPLDEGAFLRLNHTVEVEEKRSVLDTDVDGFGKVGKKWRFFNSLVTPTTSKPVKVIKTGLELATRWQKTLSIEDRMRIFDDCKEFYKSVEYPWSAV